MTRLAVIFTVAMIAALMTLAHRAKAHDWYPIECCSGMDCAPAEKVEILPTGAIASMLVPPAHAAPSVMVVTTKHGTAIVPANFPHRASKDGRVHACMRLGANGSMRLICIFLPPSM